MLNDLVIDTNVLMHADNQQEPRRESCHKMLAELRKRKTCLCVDEGFDLVDSSKNRSRIGCEYLKLVPGGLAYEIIAYLAKSSRIKFISRKVTPGVRKIVRVEVYDPSDRVFVLIAANSDSKTLASHDFDNFPRDRRKSILKKIGVSIVSAKQASTLLEAP